MMPTALQLYEKLKPKLGEQEARELLEFVETSVENRAATKADLQQAISGLREELHREATGLRKEIQDVRTDVLKRSFAFWVGNVAIMSGILFAMLRTFR